MMFVHHGPLAVDLAQAYGQAKVEIDVLSTFFGTGTLHQSGDKCHVAAGSDVHLGDIEDHRNV